MLLSEIRVDKLASEVVRDMIAAGEAPSVESVISALEERVNSLDISAPAFDASSYTPEEGSNASASLVSSSFETIYRDLDLLYESLFESIKINMDNFDRWKAKAASLSKRASSLEDRIEDLLLLNSETGGYLYTIQDDFSDTSKIDSSSTTAKIDTKRKAISIGSTLSQETTPTRKFPSLSESDSTVSLHTKNNIIATSVSTKSKLIDVFDYKDGFWQYKVYTDKPIPVTIEIKVKIGCESINGISIDLHQSSFGGTTLITPLYSSDGYSWNELPSSSGGKSLYIKDEGIFRFPTIDNVSYFKFILAKSTFDIKEDGLYLYEFGLDEISFHQESSNTSSSGVILQTDALSVTDRSTKQPVSFKKATLDVCEKLESSTSIEYYLAALVNSSDTPSWVQISPTSRENPICPVSIDFKKADISSLTGVGISYDPTNISSQFVNPKKTYTIVSSVSGSTVTTTTATASAQRYTFSNKEDRILSIALPSSLSIDINSLEIWRNVNTKGSTTLVRDYSNGWGYDDTYYSTTIYVSNSSGVKVDFGAEPVIIDDVEVKGKTTISYGSHTVKVHKDNWKYVSESGITSEGDLRDGDSLYPYNHRYLIEGFNYPSDYSTKDKKIYRGFDVVAQYLMKKVSISDMIDSVDEDNYSVYAMDYDAQDMGRSISDGSTLTDPLKVFLLKVDSSNSDFINEEFTLRFRASSPEYNYVKLRAILKTTDSSISPLLSSYRIKIA